MRAIRIHRQGGPERLFYEEALKPTLRAGDALVRVHSCAITPTELTWSATFSTQEGTERLPSIPGHELSGVIEAVQSDAAGMNIGDAVYALTDFWRDGAAAEYVAVRAADLAPKPRNLTHTQAAAVPLSGLTAWQALFDHAGLSGGQRVLIHGAAGGVGTFAVQLGRWRGAYVIGTAQLQNAGFLRDLGCDDVIDYAKVRFEDRVGDLDVVLDTVGGDTLERSWRLLKPGGVLVTVAGSAPAEKSAQYGVRGVEFIVKPNRTQLTEITRLLEAGKIRPIIEGTFSLERAREAFEYGLRGHNRGKLVLEIAEHQDKTIPWTRVEQQIEQPGPKDLRIAVIGAGPVGGYFGGRLAQAGENIVFVERGATLRALREKGLRVDSPDGNFIVQSIAATEDPHEVGTVDVVLAGKGMAGSGGHRDDPSARWARHTRHTAHGRD